MKKQLLLAMALVLGSGVAAMAADLSAGRPAKLAEAASGLMAPVWSPDGTKVAASGPNYTGIYVFSADGTQGRQVTMAEGAGYKMAWNANGTEIVGRVNVREGLRVMHEIKAWNVTTGEMRTVVKKQRSNATPGSINKDNLYADMVNDAAGVASKVSALGQFAGRTIINPALSPDGKKIAFQVVGKGMWVINVDGSGLRSLGKGSHPSWMPDSRTIVYTVVTDNGSSFTGSTVMALDLAEKAPSILISDSSLVPLTPAVSPDGTKMVFENARDAAIYVVTLK